MKAVFNVNEGNPDYLSYQVDFLLDQDVERGKNQIEVCRFHLREGSVLRDTYKDFADMNTEYDTVNLLHATVSGRGQGRLHPKILLKYAETLQRNGANGVEDMAFCYHILQQNGEVERTVVEAYLRDKWKNEITMDAEMQQNEICFKRLEALLNQRTDNRDKGLRQRVIFVE